MTGELRPADHGQDPVARGELRVSYEDRDRVAEELRVAAGDGRRPQKNSTSAWRSR